MDSKFIKIHNVHLGVLKNKSLKTIVDSYLSHREKRRFNRFLTPKRQLEWLAGRVAVKEMVYELCGAEYKKTEVENDDNRAPKIRNRKFWDVSISHSNDYAVASLFIEQQKRIGIDIERIEEMKSLKFCSMVFTDKEMEYIQGKGTVGLYELWVIKEAFLKYIKKGFKENPKNVEIIHNDIYYRNHLMQQIAIDVNFFKKEYIYAVVCDKN